MHSNLNVCVLGCLNKTPIHYSFFFVWSHKWNLLCLQSRRESLTKCQVHHPDSFFMRGAAVATGLSSYLAQWFPRLQAQAGPPHLGGLIIPEASNEQSIMLSAHWLRVSSAAEKIIVMEIAPVLSTFPNKLGANESVSLSREKWAVKTSHRVGPNCCLAFLRHCTLIFHKYC